MSSQDGILWRLEDGELVWQGVMVDDAEYFDDWGGSWNQRRDHPGEEHSLRFHPDESFTCYCTVCGEVDLVMPRPSAADIQAAQELLEDLGLTTKESDEASSS